MVKGLAGVSFALLLSTFVRAAQSPVEQIPQSSVFRSGASLVALNVSVVGPDKHFVTGLDASDFVVLEDGVRQEVRFFESSAVPVDLIILLDTSSSMRHRMEMVHEAALGAKVDVRTLEGTARLRIPPGTQSGQRFRLRGHGAPSTRNGQRGDLIVEVRIMLPRLLDERTKELLREFARINVEPVRE